MRMAIPFIIGLLLGVPLTLVYPRFRDKPLIYRLGVGLLVGVGIAMTINILFELLELVELPTF